MWFITKIKICGFPKYACGHTYILLTGGPRNVRMLAHLGIQTEQRLSLPRYSYYYVATTTLQTSIRLTELPDEMLKKLKHVLISTCTTWIIDSDAVGQKVYEKIHEQSRNKKGVGPFLVYGKTYARFLVAVQTVWIGQKVFCNWQL